MWPIATGDAETCGLEFQVQNLRHKMSNFCSSPKTGMQPAMFLFCDVVPRSDVSCNTPSVRVGTITKL